MKTISMKELNNKLYLGSYSLEELANKYGTPLYVFDEVHLRNKLDTFKNYFKSDKYECNVVYASKAYFAPYLANIIKEYKFGMDSVSLGDLHMIKDANFNLNDVVLHGNNKNDEELEYAINNNIGIIACDNLTEMKKLVSISDKLNKDINVILRVNPGIEAHTHEYIQTSLLSSKFGESIYDEEKIKEIVYMASNSKHIKFRGFHCHIGSSINQAKSFIDAVNTMLEFELKMSKITNHNFDILNIGGGFGIKYLDSDKEINLEEMLSSIVSTVDEFVLKNNMNLSKLMIEPGRSIVGDSCITLYKAGISKTTYSGKKYLFIDGGMTDNIRPALYKAEYSIDNASNMNGNKTLVDVVGPCCESGDIIAKDVMVQDANEGDIIVSYSTGAYCYSMSSNYNGALKAASIFVLNDKVNMAVYRETYDDLSRKFVKQMKHKIFDTHSDMLYDLWTKKSRGVENHFSNIHVNQLDNSVIKGAIWTMYSEFDFDLIDACKVALKEIKMDELKDFNVILGLEGLRNLKDIKDIDTLYEMGFRHAMLTWNEENVYATGAKSNPEHGLKEKGIELLKRMEELDMIVDLAHLNEKSFYEVLDHVNKNIIYSHGNCKALCNHPRNLTDDQMRALKAKDGLMGLTLAASFIDEDKNNRTFDRFAEHIKHAIDIMGIDNVCFGFDFMDYLSEFPNSNLSDVSNASKSYRIIEKLESIGLSDEDIDKICYDNFYKRFKDKVVLRSK